MGIWAKSILASRHAATGSRLDTMLLRMPRCILAEFNTHRALSRNAASSRAIPVEKLIQQVLDDPFVPMKWTKNQPGMQGYEECNEFIRTLTGEWSREDFWLSSRDSAVSRASRYYEAGYHKQIVNRLLEPFMWVIVLASGTDAGWNNFLKLRDHEAAEPHMQMLAQAVRKARDEAKTQILEPGEWHLPFIQWSDGVVRPGMLDWHMLSVARCASTSYKTTDGFDMTMERAQSIWDKLKSEPLHASPFEHVAQADFTYRTGLVVKYDKPQDHRNFDGFRQLRADVEAGKI